MFGAVANMMNGCISHIYPNFWKCVFTRKWLQETGPHTGQTNVNDFLKKPMPLIQNIILKNSTMCIILCNIHVRLAIRENPDQIVKGKGHHWPLSYNKRYLYVLVVSRTNHKDRDLFSNSLNIYPHLQST